MISAARVRTLLLTSVVAAGAWMLGPATPAVTAAQDAAPVVAGTDNQVDLAVTVYNSNVALVRDVREVSLPAGVASLHLADIAAAVNPASVVFRSLSDPDRLSVLEQNYQFDLLEPQRLLRKYVGRDVRLIRSRQENGTTVQEEVTARLLAFNNQPVWQIGTEIVTGLQAEQYRFPEIPETLHSRPTLVMQLENSGGTRHRIETSYLTGNMTWNADYVLTVARNEAQADLDGWVTLLNTSGASYRNARLQLVAGELHRVQREVKAQEQAVGRAAVAASEAPFSREAFSEYHLYALERRTTVAENETKQIAMLDGTGIPVRKRFVVNGQQFYYRNRQQPGSPIRDSVRVFYELRNDEASGLGAPMPAGVVRVYQADTPRGVQIPREERNRHTPKDENLAHQNGTAYHFD
jgi:hypothetical protein